MLDGIEEYTDFTPDRILLAPPPHETSNTSGWWELGCPYDLWLSDGEQPGIRFYEEHQG
jgi:hypothetical protein